MNKSKIIVVFVAILIIATVVGAIVFLWRPYDVSVKKSDSQSTTVVADDKTTADIAKEQELQVAKDKKTAEDIAYYEKKRQEYLDAGDMDAVIDMDAKIYMLNHPSVPSTVKVTDSTATGSGRAGD
jgi:cell division protein YceG involved in septum cleavage